MERTYTIPLRKGWLKAPKYKRAKKAVNTIKEFLIRHMKSEDVRLMPDLNLEIWKHGMKNPPSRVKVNVVKDDKGVVRAQLFGVKVEEKKPEEKKGIVKKITEKVAGKEAKPEIKTELKPAPVQKAPEVKVEKPVAKPVEKKVPVKKAKPAEAKPAK